MHRIEGADKQEGIEQAWHRLTVIRPDLDLDHNWLTEWEIMAVPTFIEQDGVRTELPFQQLVASDDPRVIIGAPFADSFRPIRNSEFLGMLQEAFAGTAHQLASIGTIRGRGRIGSPRAMATTARRAWPASTARNRCCRVCRARHRHGRQRSSRRVAGSTICRSPASTAR